MSTTWTLKEKSTGELEVTIEGETWTAATEKAFKKLAAKTDIRGFRKGKAPRNLLESRISMGERQVTAIDDNANDWMRAALAENNLEPISQPQLDVKEVNAEKCVLLFTFEVEPEAEVGDYKSLEYVVEEVEVSDEEIEDEITTMRERYAEVADKEGAAEKGDIVNIDYTGKKDGVEFAGGSATGYDLELGSNTFIPGFEDQLIGVTAGETKDLDLSFPEDYHNEELKGAAVVFTVKVNSVKTKTLPEVDDDFAADVQMKGVSTAAELRDAVRERIASRRKNEAESAAEEKLMDGLAAITTVEIPDSMIESEVQNQINGVQQQLQQYGMSLTQYIQMMGMDAESFKNSYREQAEKTVKVRLGLAAVAKAEGFVPTAEDLEAEYKNIADSYQMEVSVVKQYISDTMLMKDVANQKAVDFLKGNNK